MPDFVSDAIRDASVNAQVLESSQREGVIAALRAQFHLKVETRAPWDDVASEGVGCHCPDGWRLIPQFVGPSKCLMFLSHARTIWQFGSGGDLLRVLEEAPSMEFYVCDPETTYLLCHNDHDWLIAWGAATAWAGCLPDSSATTPDKIR